MTDTVLKFGISTLLTLTSYSNVHALFRGWSAPVLRHWRVHPSGLEMQATPFLSIIFKYHLSTCRAHLSLNETFNSIPTPFKTETHKFDSYALLRLIPFHANSTFSSENTFSSFCHFFAERIKFKC